MRHEWASLRVIAFAVSAIAVLSGGCKRDYDEPLILDRPAAPGLIQRLTYVEGSDTTLYLFWYGTDSLVDSFQIYWRGAYQYTKVFLHQADFIRSEYPATGAWAGNIRWDTLNLDAATGRVVRSAQNIGPIRPMLPTHWYYYNAAGELIYTKGRGYPGNPDTVAHTWTNGDLVMSYGERGDTTRYGYDLTRASLPGDPWQWLELARCGRNRATGAHLRTSMRDANGMVTNYQYTYDSVGRITRMQLLGGASPSEYFSEY